MIRVLLIWLILSFAIGFGIAGWHRLTDKAQWALTKYIAYATMCSALAGFFLSFIVVLF